MRKGIKVGLIVLLSFLSIVILVGKILLSTPEYPVPTGEYSVGSHLFIIEDENRNEILSKEYKGYRKIAIQAFYPAVPDTGKEFLIVDDKRIMSALSDLYGMPIEGSDSRSITMVDAKAVKGEFPVILFSHGSTSYGTQNLTTMEELASRGYIVLAISHTYEAVATLLPDGGVILSEYAHILEEALNTSAEDHEIYIKQLDKLRSNVSNKEKMEILKNLAETSDKIIVPLLDVRVKDVDFIGRNLEVIANRYDLTFKSSMDLEKVGIFGHSLGGMTAQAACSVIDTPFKAGINMDATHIVYNNDNHILQTPFAFFYGSEIVIPGLENYSIDGTNAYFRDTTDKETYALIFEGATHNNFSDMNLVPLLIKLISGMGYLDGERMLEMQNSSVAEYFDYALKGQTDNLYSTLETGFKEISINRQ